MYHPLKTLIPLILICTLLIGYSYTESVWQEPAAGPIATTNTSAPINVGTTPQSKTGALGLDNLIVFGDAEVDGTIKASTSVWSREYCDEGGGNCMAGGSGVGVGQTWQSMNGIRTAGTSYQNTTGVPIQVHIQLGQITSRLFQVSSDNTNWITLQSGDGNAAVGVTAVIPEGSYYKVVGAYERWSELR